MAFHQENCAGIVMVMKIVASFTTTGLGSNRATSRRIKQGEDRPLLLVNW